MGGAYTAIAETVPSPPDVPPGWDILWPFPGPFPPGYTPELTLTGTGQSQMAPSVPVTNVSISLEDHVTYVTDEPTGTLTYSAAEKVSETAVGIKFQGGSSFQSSVSGSYFDIGSSFWGSTPDFEFNVSAADVGKTIVLTITSTPFTGYPVTETMEFLVVSALTVTGYTTQTYTFSGGGVENYHTMMQLAREDEFEGQFAHASLFYYNGSWQAYLSDAAGYMSATNPFEAANKSKITVSQFIAGTYYYYLESVVSAPAPSSVALSLTMNVAGAETTYTKTKEWTEHHEQAETEYWLTIDGTTGEVTILNP